MPSIDSNSRFESENRKVDCVQERLAPDEDLVMEQILENIEDCLVAGGAQGKSA